MVRSMRTARGQRFAVTVRLKIALTILITGLLTAAGVIATVAIAFQRFEHETAYDRASAFLGRVVATYDNLFELQDRYPEQLNALLRNLLLFEADTQLYLLDAEGLVLSSTGAARLPAGFKVALGPVRKATHGDNPAKRMPYVMGDDPERMDANAVIAARPLTRQAISPTVPLAGYLYLVTHKQELPDGRVSLRFWRTGTGGCSRRGGAFDVDGRMDHCSRDKATAPHQCGSGQSLARGLGSGPQRRGAGLAARR